MVDYRSLGMTYISAIYETNHREVDSHESSKNKCAKFLFSNSLIFLSFLRLVSKPPLMKEGGNNLHRSSPLPPQVACLPPKPPHNHSKINHHHRPRPPAHFF